MLQFGPRFCKVSQHGRVAGVAPNIDGFDRIVAEYAAAALHNHELHAGSTTSMRVQVQLDQLGHLLAWVPGRIWPV